LFEGDSFTGAGSSRPEQLAGQAAIPLLLTSSLLGGESAWAGLSDDALLAQGRASGQMAPAFRDHLLPSLPGLAERLAAPGARMLDVGTGVGAIAVAFAQAFPALSVVGIDVMQRVLSLAEASVAASDVADRVEIRRQDVATLDDTDRYDLAWLPGPFVPAAAVQDGVGRLLASLRSGGWLLVGHGKFTDDPVENALNRFKTLAYGGTALDDASAQALLSKAGLVDVTTLRTPPGAPALTVGRRA
jgi:SAM-dependent methyltransferase